MMRQDVRGDDRAACCTGADEPRMIEAVGRVVATSPGSVTLTTRRMGACSSCGVAQTCGTAALGKLMGGGDPRMTLPSEGTHSVGDEVTIAISETGLLAAAALAYLVPVAGLMAGAALAALAGAGELIMLAGAGVGLVAGLAVSHRLSRMPALMMRLVPLGMKH